MTAMTESVVEDAALAWLENLDYTLNQGFDIGPGDLAVEHINGRCL